MAANAINLPPGFVIDEKKNNVNLPPGFQLDSATPEPEQEPMTLGGFGKNIARGVGDFAGAVTSVATAIPKAGFNIGKDIAQTLKQNRSVIDPYRGIKEVGKKILSPVTSPIDYAKDKASTVSQMSGELGKSAVRGVKKFIDDPVRTTYENPVEVASFLAPPALKLGSKIVKGARAAVPITQADKLAKADKLTKSATARYRDMLRPGKGEYNKIEIRGKRKLDDFYELAAKEKLPIEHTVDGKFNTLPAREALRAKQGELYDKLDAVLSKSKSTVDLKSIGKKSKVDIENYIKNARELKHARKQIDQYIADEIKLRGRHVTVKDANTIKQGMWSVSYNQSAPNANKVARNIGHIMREEIERVVPEVNVKMLNRRSGDYLTLDNLLKTANGRAIKGGRLGDYFAGTVGAGVGMGTAHALTSGMPYAVKGVAIPAGAEVGRRAGMKAARYFNQPERISRIAGKETSKAGRLLESAAKKKDFRLGSLIDKEKLQQGAILPKSSLMQEAKKYKTADEFVEAQGTPVYRGGDEAIDITRGGGRGISVTDKETAELFTAPGGGVLDKAFLPKTAKVLKEKDIPKALQDSYMADAKKLANEPFGAGRGLQKTVLAKQQKIVDYAREKGFDAVEFPFEKEIRIVKANVLKTRSQLIDMWNKAHNK